MTGYLSDVRHQAVAHFLAIGEVAFQVACQQLLLAPDAQNAKPNRGLATRTPQTEPSSIGWGALNLKLERWGGAARPGTPSLNIPSRVLHH